MMSVSVFGFADDSPCLNAAGALLQYLLDTQKNSLAHIKKLLKTSGKDYMAIDAFTAPQFGADRDHARQGKARLTALAAG